jgi:hypothetical protein
VQEHGTAARDIQNMHEEQECVPAKNSR